MTALEKLAQAVIEGNTAAVEKEAKEALAAEVPAALIIDYGLIEGMNKVGKLFKSGEAFVPEVLMSAKAMQAGLEIIKPLLSSQQAAARGTVVIGTVQKDLHDIGKNIVALLLRAGGFKVIDLGTNVEAKVFIGSALEHDADIIAMSALLTTTMPGMEELVKRLKSKGLRERFKVIVGGAPVTEEYAQLIGSDGYAPDAPSAVELCLDLLQL